MRKCTVYNPTTLDDDVLDDDVLDDDDVPLFLSTYIQPFPLSHRSILLLPYTRFTGAPLAFETHCRSSSSLSYSSTPFMSSSSASGVLKT
jgi:hypothetical protein